MNEEEGVGPCVAEAKKQIEGIGYTADIVVVDNGCTDRSPERARAAGARVVKESRRGYGRAIRTGIEAAHGAILFMADADGTYDLEKIPAFVEGITKHNADLVIGNRYHKIEKGAMPVMHRYLGTPILTLLLKMMFRTSVRDVNCGMRAFTRDAYDRLNLVTTGMEFASEMVVRAFNHQYVIREVNFTYHARVGDSKLRTLRDGLRHVRLLFLYSPDFLFLVPAAVCWILGAVLVLLLYPNPLLLGERAIDIHTMLVGATLNLCGLYLGSLGIIAKAYGHFTGLRLDRWISFWSGRLRLTHGLAIGAVCAVLGFAFIGTVINAWFKVDFGNISYVRELVLGLVSVSNGIVVVATSFVLSLMVIQHTPEKSPVRG